MMEPTVWFTCQEERLRESIAKCQAWQTITGVPEAESIDFIHVDIVERDDETKEIMLPLDVAYKRPFGLVWSENPSIAKVATDAGIVFGGEMLMVFEIETAHISDYDPTANTEGQRLLWWKDHCGQLLYQLFTEHYFYYQRTIEIGWRSHRAEDLAGDVPHMQFWCRFLMGYEE